LLAAVTSPDTVVASLVVAVGALESTLDSARSAMNATNGEIASREQEELLAELDLVVPVAVHLSREFSSADGHEAVEKRDVLRERVSRFLDVRQKANVTVAQQLSGSTAFHNPATTGTLVEYANIDEFGSNLPPEFWENSVESVDPSDFYDAIERARGREHVLMAERQRQRSTVEFVRDS
jgi:hypothetical protein